MLTRGPLDVLDDLLAGALRCLSHRPLLSGYDEPATLSYQIDLFGPISADVRHLGTVFGDWANATGRDDLRQKERHAKEEAANITRALRGMRHPEMAVTQNNLAAMHANLGDLVRATEHMAQAVAIGLSLDLMTHPQTQSNIAHLIQLWTHSGQSDKAARLQAGDFADVAPIVEQIEAEHRAWVAEDPENRDFGPPSPVTGARE